MTEAEWLACEAPTPMLHFVQGTVNERKLVFFVVGALRQCRTDPFLKQATLQCYETAERYTEGQIAWANLRELFGGIYHFPETPFRWAERLTKGGYVGIQICERISYKKMCRMIREVLGNPYRPVSADPSWLTSPVLDLARTMYDSRDFSPMPILADALEDAGCAIPDVLAHCRGDTPHVRGCWLVDLLTGRS